MPWCPKCKKEYEHGAVECEKCHVALVQEDQHGNAGEPEKLLMDPVLVYEAENTTNAAMVCDMLSQKHIAAAVHDREDLGGVLRIYTGSSMYGMQVYVDRSQADRAKEELSVWLADAEESALSPEELSRQALAGLSDEELARQAEAAEPQEMTANSAYEKLKWVVTVGVIAAVVLLWVASHYQ